MPEDKIAGKCKLYRSTDGRKNSFSQRKESVMKALYLVHIHGKRKLEKQIKNKHKNRNRRNTTDIEWKYLVTVYIGFDSLKHKYSFIPVQLWHPPPPTHARHAGTHPRWCTAQSRAGGRAAGDRRMKNEQDNPEQR